MTNLREAAQQALEAWDGGDIEWFKRAYTVMENLRTALAQQEGGGGNLPPPLQAEPVAWMYDCGGGGRMYAEALDGVPGWVPLYTAPPRCPNCASLEAQNTELDRKLAELEQAYQSEYNAGVAAERKRIIQFLNEMQRQVGDGHNYYGVAAMRIRERV